MTPNGGGRGLTVSGHGDGGLGEKCITTTVLCVLSPLTYHTGQVEMKGIMDYLQSRGQGLSVLGHGDGGLGGEKCITTTVLCILSLLNPHTGIGEHGRDNGLRVTEGAGV